MRRGPEVSGWVGSLFPEPIEQVKVPSDRCVCYQDCPQYETCETEALDKNSKVYYLLRCVKGKFPACANCMCMTCDRSDECQDGPEKGLRGGVRYRMCNRPISITGCLDYSGSIPWKSEAYCKECDHICDLRKELFFAPRVRCDPKAPVALVPVEPTKPAVEPWKPEGAAKKWQELHCGKHHSCRDDCAGLRSGALCPFIISLSFLKSIVREGSLPADVLDDRMKDDVETKAARSTKAKKPKPELAPVLQDCSDCLCPSCANNGDSCTDCKGPEKCAKHNTKMGLCPDFRWKDGKEQDCMHGCLCIGCALVGQECKECVGPVRCTKPTMKCKEYVGGDMEDIGDNTEDVYTPEHPYPGDANMPDLIDVLEGKA